MTAVIRWSVIFLAFGSLLLSCTKDVGCLPFAVDNSCVSLPVPDGPWTGWDYRFNEHYFRDARYNPDNANKIIFIHAPYAGLTRQLILMDLQTMNKQVVYDGQIIFPSDWISNDWLTLNLWADVYKIKTNGDSLTRLTFNGNSFAPILNHDRTKIGYHLTGGLPSHIIDLNGVVLDTVPYACGFKPSTIWNGPDSFIALNNDGVLLTVIDDCEVQLLTPPPTDATGGGTGITQISPTELIWGYVSGVYRSSIQNPELLDCLIPTCNSSYYLGYSANPIEQTILSVRMDLTPVANDLYVNSTLVTFDTDGNNIQEIPIQW